MKIDQGTIITALFFLLIFSIPFILLFLSRRKREKQNLVLLNREAGKNNLRVSKFNTWGNTSIGMDETANVVFFTKKTADGDTGLQMAFPFFNMAYDGAMLTGELQQAEKWCRIINERITGFAQNK